MYFHAVYFQTFRFRLVKIKGKRGRRVPVLLSKEMVRGIELIVKFQKEYSPTADNYIFVLPHQSKPLAGWTAIKTVTAKLGDNLEQPEAVTSTNVRKYVATVSQVW